MTQWTSLRGTLAEGYRVASGPSADYPYGSLERQRPIFKARGLDLTAEVIRRLDAVSAAGAPAKK